ncbi:MAG: hypothetical protein AAF065_05885 [Verrucomicrobiota bacterium]
MKRLEVKDESKKRIPFIFLFFSGVAVLLVVFAAYTVFRSEPAREVTPLQAELKPQRNLEELVDKQVFKRAYIEANGGFNHLQNLTTLKMNGRLRLKDDDVDFDFFILKRRPDMMLMTYKFGAYDLTYGSKDGKFWMRQSYPEKPDKITDVSEEKQANLAPSINMFGPLLSAYLDQSDSIESIELADWEGHACLHIVMKSLDDGSTTELYVDGDSLQILVQIVGLASGETTMMTFSDYVHVNKVNIPFTSVLEKGGKEINRIFLDSVQFNVGASSSLFEN